MTKADIRVALELPEDQAMALAQLAKRFSFTDAQNLSAAYDGGGERDTMIQAVCTLARALRDAGFAPR